MYRLYAKYLAPQETEGRGGDKTKKSWRAGKKKKIRSGEQGRIRIKK